MWTLNSPTLRLKIASYSNLTPLKATDEGYAEQTFLLKKEKLLRFKVLISNCHLKSKQVFAFDLEPNHHLHNLSWVEGLLELFFFPLFHHMHFILLLHFAAVERHEMNTLKCGVKVPYTCQYNFLCCECTLRVEENEEIGNALLYSSKNKMKKPGGSMESGWEKDFALTALKGAINSL